VLHFKNAYVYPKEKVHPVANKVNFGILKVYFLKSCHWNYTRNLYTPVGPIQSPLFGAYFYMNLKLRTVWREVKKTQKAKKNM
jgi:hypothetical protein